MARSRATTRPRATGGTSYDDPALDALVAQVELSNQTIAGAEARVRQASAATQAARAALYPFVDLGVGAARSTRATPARDARPTAAYNIALGASWEPDLWGGIRRNVEGAGATRAGHGRRPRQCAPVGAGIARANYLLLRVLDAQIAAPAGQRRGVRALASAHAEPLRRRRRRARRRRAGRGAAEVDAGAGRRRPAVARAARACDRGARRQAAGRARDRRPPAARSPSSR